MALERYFPASWGPRLERILKFALHSVLEAVPHATLADVQRVLTESRFREQVVEKLTTPMFVNFWDQAFAFLPGNALDPVLNKLTMFLLDDTVRNVVTQRRSRLDFDRLLNGNGILLANLSAGLLGEKVAGTFGSFLVTKLINASFRRAALRKRNGCPGCSTSTSSRT